MVYTNHYFLRTDITQSSQWHSDGVLYRVMAAEGDQTIYNTVICHVGFVKGIKQLLVLLNWCWVEWNFGAQSETAGWRVPKPSKRTVNINTCSTQAHVVCWMSSLVLWLMTETSSFLPPWKHVDFGSCCSVEGLATEPSSELINGSSGGGDTDMRYLQLQWSLSLHNVIWTQGRRFHQEINLWSFSNRPAIFYESYTVIYENIIPAVYVAVIDLFMKTAIVLRSVSGSQTAERLQVEVIVLWMQWNRSPLPTPPSKQNHCSKLAKLTELPQCSC